MARSGVIHFQGAPVAYDCHDEERWLALEIGRPGFLGITTELRDAIAKDRAYQDQKRGRKNEDRPATD